MIKWLNRHFISILFILFVICIGTFVNNRILNDDVGLELCYSGYFSGGTPVSDHLFQHFFLTYFLSFLYTYLNTFNWYFYIHLFFLALSFFTILNVLKNSKNKYYILILVVILFFIEYIYFTFTRISFYVTFSGFLFFLKKDKLDRHQFICSFLMVFLGSIIRPESGFLALILFSLLFLSDNNFKNKILDKSFFKKIIVVSLLPVVILVTHHISNLENSKRFLVSNLNVTESKLYKGSSFDNEIFDVYDFTRLKQFYFDERFTSKKVFDYVKSKKTNLDFKNKIYYSVDRLAYIFLYQRMYLFLFLIMFLQIFLKNGIIEKIKFILVITFFVSFLIFVDSFLDLKVYKDRVMEPLFLSIIISSLYYDYIFELKIKKYILLFILLIFTYLSLNLVINDRYISQDKSVEIEVSKVYEHIPKNEMIFDPLFFSLKILYPGNVQIGQTQNFKNYRLLPIGWTQRSYSSKVLYHKMGVKKMDDLLVKSNTTLIVDPSHLILWNNYGTKYLDRNLVPYDTVYINNSQICYYLSKYRSTEKSN